MASLVAAGHFNLVPWRHAPDLGVQLFFALSGWLIGTILIEMRRDRLPLFYFNRATRVWIPYAVALAGLYGLAALREPFTARRLELLVYDLTFTHNFFTLLPSAAAAIPTLPFGGYGNHFWSLAVEEQFYLAAPILILFARGARHPLFWLALALAALLVRQEFAAISLGVAAAAAHHRRPGFQLHRGVRAGLALLLAATAPLLAFEATYAPAVPFFAVAALLLLARPGQRGRAGTFLGGVSYPLYLNHWAGMIAAHGLLGRLGVAQPQWIGLAALVLAFAIGAVAYLLVDRPMLARRRAWYRPRLGAALGGAAYLLVAAGVGVGLSRHGA